MLHFVQNIRGVATMATIIHPFEKVSSTTPTSLNRVRKYLMEISAEILQKAVYSHRR